MLDHFGMWSYCFTNVFFHFLGCWCCSFVFFKIAMKRKRCAEKKKFCANQNKRSAGWKMNKRYFTYTFGIYIKV